DRQVKRKERERKAADAENSPNAVAVLPSITPRKSQLCFSHVHTCVFHLLIYVHRRNHFYFCFRASQLDRKRSWEMMFREKPDLVRDREAERALQRTATRGVVQLFNAVRKHQKTLDQQVKEAGSSERKKAKILSSFSKKDFIGALRRTEEGAEQKPSWSVLSDDFMMGATMKDWDKDSGAEEAEPHSDGGSGDSD
uniref:RRP15-like protein n=1 Tax=Oryzias latipes TaxID=8090 RepID=A0A3P9HRL9_ORYLA